VRTFRDERERTLMLVVDFRESMMFGTRRALRSVAGAEAVIALGWGAIDEGGGVGLLAELAHAQGRAGHGTLQSRQPCAAASRSRAASRSAGPG